MTVMRRVFPFSAATAGSTTITYEDPVEILYLQDEDEYEIVEIDD